tara:strand:- start:288 stop:524 length:237 start_codon:yes stop_codon:yes gene_type:complete
MMQELSIMPGDRFVKLSDPGTVWVAEKKAKLAYGMPPHINLVNEEIPSRKIIMAQSALQDKKLFRRLDSHEDNLSLDQ